MSSFKNRIIKSALLDTNIYEEVEADSGALMQAKSGTTHPLSLVNFV